MTLAEFSENYYLHESHFEDIKIKDGGSVVEIRLGLCYWMQDWYDARVMPQKGSALAVFSGVSGFELKEGFDYLKAGIAEAYLKDGALLFGLWDEDHSEYAYIKLTAESVEVSGPVLNVIQDPPSAEDLKGKGVYLCFRLEYDTRPLWVVDSTTNVMLNRTFPEGWPPDKGLIMAFSEIRDLYKGLFVNNIHEFSYRGFRSDDERFAFSALVERMKKVVRERNNGEYYILDDIDTDKL